MNWIAVPLPLGRGLVRQRQPLLPFEYFGKGNVHLFDDKDYSIRMWLNPRQLAAYNLTPAEVMTATKTRASTQPPLIRNDG
jgi:hypothetical protein